MVNIKSDKSLNKLQFVERTAEKNEISPRDMGMVLGMVLEGFMEPLVTGEATKISITGFGTFEVVTRAARMARNPQTGVPVLVPEHKALVFTPAQAIKDMLNGKKAIPTDRAITAKAAKSFNTHTRRLPKETNTATEATAPKVTLDSVLEGSAADIAAVLGG